MKSISAALQTHLSQPSTTVALCWKVTRRDGTIFGFTDHDQDISLDGVTYLADTGFSSSNVVSSARLDVDNLEVSGMLASDAITEVDLAAGLWDYATVEIVEVNYADLTMGSLGQKKGWLGEVRTGRNGFTAEIRGLAQALQQTIGELYSPGCRATFGDARCGLNIASWTTAAAVTADTDRRSFSASSLTQAAGYFDWGLVTWTSGLNDGLSMEVKTFAAGAILLQLPMPYIVGVGDTFNIVAGCQKRLIEDCKTKFNNVVNFRGEPYVPGVDQMLKGPTR